MPDNFTVRIIAKWCDEAVAERINGLRRISKCALFPHRLMRRWRPVLSPQQNGLKMVSVPNSLLQKKIGGSLPEGYNLPKVRYRIALPTAQPPGAAEWRGHLTNFINMDGPHHWYNATGLPVFMIRKPFRLFGSNKVSPFRHLTTRTNLVSIATITHRIGEQPKQVWIRFTIYSFPDPFYHYGLMSAHSFLISPHTRVAALRHNLCWTTLHRVSFCGGKRIIQRTFLIEKWR